MSCTRIRSVLDACLDGELDVVHAAEVEQHVAGCPTCRDHWQQLRTLRTAIRENAQYYRAPPSLRDKSLQALSPTSVAGRRRFARAPVHWPALAASTLIVALVAGGGSYWLAVPSPQEVIAEQIVSSHVRSLMSAARTTDVSSSDQHTVKPWFSGKLDFAPPVVDLTTEGFPLVGGRLDYLARRPVAALVYRHRQHIINLFVWPTGTMNEAPRRIDRQGYHFVYWTQFGMEYWAVSDLNREWMERFGQVLRARLESAEGGNYN